MLSLQTLPFKSSIFIGQVHVQVWRHTCKQITCTKVPTRILETANRLALRFAVIILAPNRLVVNNFLNGKMYCYECSLRNLWRYILIPTVETTYFNDHKITNKISNFYYVYLPAYSSEWETHSFNHFFVPGTYKQRVVFCVVFDNNENFCLCY